MTENTTCFKMWGGWVEQSLVQGFIMSNTVTEWVRLFFTYDKKM